MIRRLSQIHRKFWTFKQPLTNKPSDPSCVVSDLFVWRKGKGWQTFFHLTDIASLFDQQREVATAKICVFDQSGALVDTSAFKLQPYSRRQIDISRLANRCTDDWGTFCVLHSKTPDAVTELGSNLAERGYVSYSYGVASVSSCVHGNIAAVGSTPSGVLDLLTGTSFLKRDYRLQHELNVGRSYHLALVNASTKMQHINCDLFTTKEEVESFNEALRVKPLRVESRYLRLHASIKPGGCHVFHVDLSEARGVSVRVVLRSRLVMLRPVVFEIDEGRINVFHG